MYHDHRTVQQIDMIKYIHINFMDRKVSWGSLRVTADVPYMKKNKFLVILSFYLKTIKVLHMASKLKCKKKNLENDSAWSSPKRARHLNFIWLKTSIKF